jgi:ubiquinone/menaquinone biosynthesis C-methylase UbiE
MPLILVHPDPSTDPRAASLMPAVGGFPPSDRELFMAGYSELCRVDLNGGRALEICGGFGMLAAGLAEVFPAAKVVGLDLYAADGPEIQERLKRLPGLSYVAGDAFDLSAYEDNSFDLIFGQAALHHLAHDVDGLAKGVARVLKPGGRLVFIFEPLGHNLLVAAIRAVHMAKYELGDESNLYFSQFNRMVHYFTRSEVQIFNLVSYPMKFFGSRLTSISRLANLGDAWLFKKFPKLLHYGANCNLVFTK